MAHILGAIITYNPDLALLNQNINSFAETVDRIVIVDNASNNIADLALLESDTIHLLRNPTNVGIAIGLNIALQYAQENNFEFILTMDQDSFFEKPTVPFLLSGFTNEKTAIVCPVLKDMNSTHLVLAAEDYVNVFTTITSGSLCRVKTLHKVGGFDSKMFIDYVDVELCLRLQKNGFKILRSQFSTLCHHLGESKMYSFLGIKFISTNHSPLRNFYYARNKVYVYKKYFSCYPVFVLRDILSFCKTVFIILFFEQMKASKIKMICRGIWQGVFYI
ncbi:glycosyltransferase family 2 protein [Flavobacterium sp.]|jgi:rhamnosyltransferase|uniref:glycosyltransferase family 2 protein n=1 Tax=Flavobacterium sp. TaxID=239 RepID=UPI0037C00B02